MKQKIYYLITLFITALLFGWLGIYLYFQPQLIHKVDRIKKLEAEVQAEKEKINSLGALHHQNTTAFMAEIKRLQAIEPKWEFYRGMYGGCVRFFVIANKGFTQKQIVGICNAFTKDHYQNEFYKLPGPPGIDRPFIQGRKGTKTS